MLRQPRMWHLGIFLSALLALALVAGCAGTAGQPSAPTKSTSEQQSAKPAQEKPEPTKPAQATPSAKPTPAQAAQPAQEQPKAQPTAKPEVQADVAFYNGKTVSFIVATKPGGGYDAYARLVAPYLQKYLPGSTVLVKNVEGAGHIIGANTIYAAPADGLTLGTFNKGLIVSQLAGMEGIKFDLAKFVWIANAATEPRAMVVTAKGPYKTVEDLIAAPEVKMGGAGVGSESSNDALMAAAILGFKVKMINGYAGQEADLAMMRGEIDGQIGTYSSMKPLIEQGEARAILIIGKEDVAGVPNLRQKAPAEKKALVDLMESQAQLARVIAATPGIPEGRAKALRDAVKKAFADPELLAKAQQAGLPINYMSGEETGDLVRAALDQKPEVIQLIKDIVTKK